MVVGIGGSSLGTRAVYDALKPKGVALSFFDTVYVPDLQNAARRIRDTFKQKREIVINVVSKSGTTNETVANARVLIDALKRARKKDWQRFMVVTTEPGSLLDQWASEQGIHSLPNPPHVGGRYSVMSAVGLFPLQCAGVDIDELHKGARRAQKKCLFGKPTENYALQSAAMLYRAMKKGKIIENLFIFNPGLEEVGKWYRQLLAESLGKEHDARGREVHAGLTPIVSVGSVDLHSTAQLYLGGPDDKCTTFVWLSSGQDVRIPNVDARLAALVPELKRKTINELMEAIYEGTKGSYKKRGLLFAEAVLPELSEAALGEFLQFKMIQTMLLGKLMGVNAFDQPNVEEYKKITRRILSRS